MALQLGLIVFLLGVYDRRLCGTGPLSSDDCGMPDKLLGEGKIPYKKTYLFEIALAPWF